MMVGGVTVSEWGEIMKAARKASNLALAKAKADKILNDPMTAAVMLYTDDPTTAHMFIGTQDMPEICGVSQIEGVAIVMGEKFPESSSEAPRTDLEMPRIAAMVFHAAGDKCPRCRKFYIDLTEAKICKRCNEVVNAQHLSFS